MADLAERALHILGLAGELSSRYQRLVAKQAAVHNKMQSLIPQVVDTLLRYDQIYEHQKEAVAKGLSDPVKCLELLRDLPANLVQSMHDMSPAGRWKAAGANRFRPLGAPVADYDETEAGRVFREMLQQACR